MPTNFSWMGRGPLRTLAAALLTMAAVTGCNQSATTGSVAVIDLDQIADQTGFSATLKAKLAEKERSLNGELLGAQAKLRQELAGRVKAAGEKPSEEEAANLKKFETAANRALANGQNTAKTLLEQERQKLAAQFRESVKVVAKQMATEKGYAIVIPKNEGLLLAISPGADITAAVAEAMKNQPAPVAAAPVPAPAPVEKPADIANAPDMPEKH